MPPDNAATVAPATAVEFPQDGLHGGGIVRASASSFILPNVGIYQVFFHVSVDEAGQLILALDPTGTGSNFSELPDTVVGRATGTSQLVGVSLVNVTVPGSLLEVRNPTGESTALTITPKAGGTDPVSAHIVITQIQ